MVYTGTNMSFEVFYPHLALVHTCIHTHTHTHTHIYIYIHLGSRVILFTNLFRRHSVRCISLLPSVSRPAVRWHLTVLSISSNSSPHYTPPDNVTVCTPTAPPYTRVTYIPTACIGHIVAMMLAFRVFGAQ